MALQFGEIPFGANQIMHMEGANERLIAATGWKPQVSLASGLDLVIDSLRAGLAADARPPEGVSR